MEAMEVISLRVDMCYIVRTELAGEICPCVYDICKISQTFFPLVPFFHPVATPPTRREVHRDTRNRDHTSTL